MMGGTLTPSNVDRDTRELAVEFSSRPAPVPPPLQPLRAESAVARRSSRLVVIGSGVFGFFAGAVCWHLLGFWWFVSDVMFHRRSDVASQFARPASTPPKAQSRQAGLAGPLGALNIEHCSVAPRDPLEVRVSACEGGSSRARPSRNVQRADFADFGPTPVPTLISGASPAGVGPGGAAVSGWSARIEKSEP
jgi:hypothetical protein